MILSIRANKLITLKARHPITSHILNTPIVVCVTNFSGIGWIKTVVAHLLNLHVTVWSTRCYIIFNGSENVGNKTMSLHKQSLLLTVQYYHEKLIDLPAEYRKWFDIPMETYKILHVTSIQNYIRQTKSIFKCHKNYSFI